MLGWSLCLVFLVAGIVWDRTNGQALANRPILFVLGLYLSAFALMMVGLWYAVRARDSQRLLPTILAFAISFRLIQLFSTPFLEIDAYRYMWDGIVVSNGFSPYAWSPAQARTSSSVDSSQQPIVDLAHSTESIHRIVSKVHYPEFTTIYPPVSQAVFATTMWLVPDSSAVRVHLVAMKLALVLFDMGTLFLLVKCLRLAGRSPGWVVGYAWNPLLIKEIANSGHLDSIAAFFVVASVWVLMRELKQGDGFRTKVAVLSAVLLSLGVGAKLFPLVLVPVFCLWIWKRRPVGSIAFGTTTLIAASAIMAPMLLAARGDSAESRDGLSGFLSKWRMNALAFDLVYENSRQLGDHVEPWYSVVPDKTRESLHAFAKRLPGSSLSPPTKLARAVTLTLFAAIYVLLLTKFRHQREDTGMLPTCIFYVLASFLLLQPTLNPWYWVWALPFVCFARNIGWHVVGGILLLYYSRFWFKFSGAVVSVGGTVYSNADCFDHFVVWVEHALFVVAVVALRRWNPEPAGSSSEN